MKKITLFVLVLFALALQACMPVYYYEAPAPVEDQVAAGMNEALAATEAPELHKPAEFTTVKVNGVEYGNDFDNRLTFTNGEILTGHTAPYSDAELAQISSTWVEYTVEMPANAAFPVAFGYSVTSGTDTYSPGVILMLPVDNGTVKVKVLDGELVLWRDLSAMHSDISDRISSEIKNGNLSIDRPLAFSWVSQEFASYIPQELMTANKVQIVK